MTKTICVWPDETWCNIDKIEEYTYMSDDYKEKQVDISWSDDQICEFIEAM